ncbi:hypothetical protein CEQ90_06585 [Lewinellaceae bacterium SD302]|nr:hypothetical protein CEQ90_06585 [Lewinellaceae bacterium SD302]
MNQSDLLKNWKKKAGKAVPERTVIGRRPAGAFVAATAGQRRLWLLQKLYPESNFYQYVHHYLIEGALDVILFEKAYRLLVARREILRANFQEAEQGLEITIGNEDHYRFVRESIGPGFLTGTATLLAKKEIFELASDPLIAAKLYTGENRHHLILSIHHIIGDRTSLQFLEKELFTIYAALLAGKEPELPELSIQFPDYAYWKREQPAPEKELESWLGYLAGPIPEHNLSADFSRPEQPTFRGATIERRIGRELSGKIDQLAREQHTTTNVVLLAAFQLLQHRYSGEDDIWVGSPVSLRDRPELEPMIGFMNETLIFRSQLKEDDSFLKLLEKLRPTQEKALKEHNVSFDDLVKKLNPERTGGWNPLFQTMFVYNAAGGNNYAPEGLRISGESVDLETAKFDLTLFATAGNDGDYLLSLEYAADLYRSNTVGSLLDNLVTLLKSIVAEPEAPVETLDLLGEASRKTMLIDWNATGTLNPKKVLESILLQARDKPDEIAVQSDISSLTYGELHEVSHQIAHQLRGKGIEFNDIVGLYGRREPETVAGILGIWLAGAAYLPLDPEYPAERINFMLADAKAKAIVDQTGEFEIVGLSAEVPTVKIPRKRVPVEAEIATGEWPEDRLAYVIYTSGSTGRPKGVAVNHANLNWSNAARRTFYGEDPICFLLLSSFSFDSSVAGLFWTLAGGGCLRLSSNRAEQDPAKMAELIRRDSVTHTLLLPSLYDLLLEYGGTASLSGLQTVMVAGESCSPALAKRHFKLLTTTVLVNEYGPTEATVWSTAHRIKPEDTATTVPIGKPVPGLKNYVLDRNRQPLPSGVEGELYISGPSLVNGYLYRPELTEERFFTNSFSNEDGYERLYRTGDRVSYRRETDGLIDFHGRMDQQVKIRGYRVEVEEIGYRLEALAGIDAARVLALDDEGGNKYLAAYYVTEEDAPRINSQQLAESLGAELPAYMVPAVFQLLDAFPRLPNGKFDLKALPALLTKEHSRPGQSEEKPSGELEELLAGIWKKVLVQDSIGRHQNFFTSGGDSLKSIRVIGEARKQGIKIRPQDIFSHQTIAELAVALDPVNKEHRENNHSEYDAVVPLKTSGFQPPLFCLHSGGGHVYFYQPLSRYLTESRPLYAIQPLGLDGSRERRFESIGEMGAYYLGEMRKVQPRGPYNLLGTCFSNAVALEIAHLLLAAGEEIESFIIVDSAPAHLTSPRNEATQGQPIRNFLRKVAAGEWDYLLGRIKKKMTIASWILGSVNDQEKRATYDTILRLNKLYADYEWKPVEVKVDFIRSSEFAAIPEKAEQLKQWSKLAKRGVELHLTEGRHVELFKDNNVVGLSEVINKILAKK